MDNWLQVMKDLSRLLGISGNVAQIVHLENESNQQSVNVARLILQRAKEKPRKRMS